MSAASDKTLRGGRYVIERTLGEGGQAETFEALDTVRGTRVALKRFKVGKAKAWKDVELAEREAKTLAELRHHRLPAYVEHFEEDGALVLVMELIEGKSLAALRKDGAIGSVQDIERLLDDARSALDYLHGRAPPIIHRDIKPANVIKKNDGSFAFVDFGSVRDRLKPAGGSTVVGTFGYMAPEQFQGRASAATDVYGVGATVLAYLTGTEPEELPHKGLAIDVPNAVPESTPPWLVHALEQMLEPDPDKRAKSIADALVQGGRKASVRPPAHEPPSRREARRELRDRRKEERDARREERRARRREARGKRAPFLPRIFAHTGLVLAQLVVWLVVGLLVPVLLYVLSVFLGNALRRAAEACRRANDRARARIGRAHGVLEGVIDEDEEEARRVRVGDDVLRRVRYVTPEQAQAEHMRRAEADGVDAEAWADERARREAERMEWEERVGEPGEPKKQRKIDR